MNKTLATILTAGAFALGAVPQAEAVQINGTIGFGLATYTHNGGLGGLPAATSITLGAATIQSVNGNLPGALLNSAISFSAPITFPAAVSGVPVTTWTDPIYFASGFALDLTTFTKTFVSPTSLILDGAGTMTGPGFDPTQGTINIALSRTEGGNQVSLTFSGTAGATGEPPRTTPDGGSTAMLLGLGLIGAAAARRKLS